MADSLVTGPDMTVEGNWTQHTIADYISMKEFTEGIRIDWGTFKQVRWNALTRGQKLGTAHGFTSFGAPSGLEASFGAGDPGLAALSAGYDYEMKGRAGSGTVLVADTTVVAKADEGERAVAFNAPNDVAIAQLINRESWGYQALAVAAILKNLPNLGASGEWRVPSFGTVEGNRSFMAAYSFNYALPFGIPVMRATFDIKSDQATTFTFAMRNTDGKALASRDVDIDAGDNQVAVVFVSVPASGMVSIDSHTVSYTITNTEVFPPIL